MITVYFLMLRNEKHFNYDTYHIPCYNIAQLPALAKELNNQVEEQRAMATLGRIHLLQGQSSTDETEAETSLKAAEKAFMKSLVLCERYAIFSGPLLFKNRGWDITLIHALPTIRFSCLL